MKRLKLLWAKYPQQILLGVTIFLFLAGVIQYGLGLSYIMRLMPIFLAAIAAVVILVWDAPRRTKAVLGAVTILFGYLIEVFGVHTGLLFGNYSYGSGMGFRLFGVPVTIGITWLLVTLSAWQIVQYSRFSVPQKFVLAGLLAVVFDLLLEQFAVAYGLWAWKGGEVPLYNYICWFVVSQLAFGLYFKFARKSQPSIYIVCILPIMAGFFWLMLLFV